MGERRISIEAKKLQQRFHQVYALSPWVKEEEIINKLPKFMKRIKIPPKEIIGFLGNKSVEEAAKELRTKRIPITVVDLYNLLEKLRESGYVRVITTKAPEMIVEVKTEVMPKVIAPPPELAKPELEGVPPVEISLPEAPAPEVVEAEAETAVVEVPIVPETRAFAPTELMQKVEDIKAAGIVERYFNLNQYLQGVVLLPREGNVVLLSMYRNVNLADAAVAVASTTIVSHAWNASETINLGDLKELIVESDNGFLVMSRLPKELVLVSLFEKGVPIGLMIRDFMGLRKEIVDILETLG
ncbi:MAG: hypothetical protein Q6363_006330 [Candidatus Njordarchaeota archaeon]